MVFFMYMYVCTCASIILFPVPFLLPLLLHRGVRPRIYDLFKDDPDFYLVDGHLSEEDYLQ